MPSPTRPLHLGFTIWPTGFHPGAWRLPGAPSDGNSNARLLRAAARTAERGTFDFFFIGDRVVGLPSSQFSAPNEVLRPEALTLAAHLAAVTDRIGLITTVNTTYAEPYAVARALATIDHLSDGRVGLNIVTGKNEEAARNFGRTEHWDNSRRYDWATEFVEVLRLLWDSWEDDARIADAATGRFVDERRVHRVDHRGEFFRVAGPLNVERPVQGQIPLVNAGASERSRQLGAAHADVRFTNSSVLGLEGARAYYRDLKGRLAAHGRAEDEQLIIPGVAVYVRPTSAEAHELYARVQRLTRPDVDLVRLSAALGLDLAGERPDAPLAEAADVATASDEGALIVAEARELYGREELTLREVEASFLRRGWFKELVGSPTEIADTLQRWHEEGAADGFMIFPPHMPDGLDAFVDLVVPELRRRGIFRTEYAGTTLRDHLGLPRPANRFAAERVAGVAR
ncbi:NtaA/DmoA family FMN-dependent monooxygenase [Streptomyces radicis]|uniref:LLM class flavin-dependent oxidoreductase n=1 Tax=Streptomyces radicis TaxID=1750517 RepID=A0A3A9WHL6_9ACTN|nr:NtaA/DmoA family FMN-dependent monooxygenase [Streptomyces radicis]RKN12518.1 LLM class flavin-dependent oxidoreductase [Streptomyces radicis]RKN27716.1 LLM class flavin-dependent oxidoreductase [Streptomyces radicis]